MGEIEVERLRRLEDQKGYKAKGKGAKEWDVRVERAIKANME